MVYQQAKVEYASTAALIPDLERKIKIMENGILLLMGEIPTGGGARQDEYRCRIR